MEIERSRTVSRKRGRIGQPLKKQSRMVSFSKRKKALLSKASELCVLCDAQLCCIIYSPSGKITVFGHSNVDYILDNFVNNTIPANFYIIHDHQGMAREYDYIKNRLKSKEKMAKIQEDVDFELTQWIENQYNGAQNVEELTNVINNFKLIKEKLETRARNMSSSVDHARNNNLTANLTMQQNNILSNTHSQNNFPNYASKSTTTSAENGNNNFDDVLPVLPSQSIVPEDIHYNPVDSSDLDSIWEGMNLSPELDLVDSIDLDSFWEGINLSPQYDVSSVTNNKQPVKISNISLMKQKYK